MVHRRLLLLFLFSVTPAWTVASDASWKSTPLLSVGDKIADDPSLTVQSIAETYWCPPDMVVLWVRVGGPESKNAMLLVSIKQGKVKSILREGSDSRSKYATPDVSPPRVVYVPPGMGADAIVPARGRAVFRWRGILEWDGEALRTLASPGGQVTIGGTTHTLQRMSAPQVQGAAENGDIILTLPVNLPREALIVAKYDGTKMALLWSSADPFPGMAGVKMNPSLRHPAGYWPAPGGVFVKTLVNSAPYKDALFWVEPGKAELITAFGVPNQGLSGPSATQAAYISSVNPAQGAQVIRADFKGGSQLVLRTAAGDLKNITPSSNQPGGVFFFKGIFVSTDPPLYLFKSSRRTSNLVWEVTDKQTVFDSYWLAGGDGKLREIAAPALGVMAPSFDPKQSSAPKTQSAFGFSPAYRHFPSGVSGILITNDMQASMVGVAKVDVKSTEIMSLALREGALFLPQGSDQLIAAPKLDTDLGPMRLESVIGFVDDDHAIAQTAGKIVLLTRIK